MLILGGLQIHLTNRTQLLDDLRIQLGGGFEKPLYLASANLHSVYNFGSHGTHRSTLSSGDDAQWRVLLDGAPLVWMARKLTGQRWEKLSGSDLLPDILTVAEDSLSIVGCLGGSPAMHSALDAVARTRWPRLAPLRTWSPSRADLEDRSISKALAQEVRVAGVDLLIVALGMPLQERWLAEHAGTLHLKVAVAFGAAADFLAGTKQRSPLVLQQIGLEWLYRLVREPRRLAKRYLVHGPLAGVRLLRDSFVAPDASAPDVRY